MRIGCVHWLKFFALQLRLEQLVGAMKESEVLKETLARARIHVDDANDWCGQLLASNIDLDLEPTALLKSVNDRCFLTLW